MGGYIGARAGTLSTTVANVQDVTATDTTPEVTLINNTHEDTDGGREGKVIFKGQQSGGEESTLAEIQGSHDGTADDEKGDLIFKTNDGSDGASPTEAMRIDSSQNVGIGTSAPDGQLHLFTSDASISPDADADDLIIEANGAAGMTIGSSASSVGSIRFADSGSPRAGMIYYDHVGNAMRLYTAATERMRIDSSGKVMIGKTTDGVANIGAELRNGASGDYAVLGTSQSQAPFIANRTSTDGDLFRFRQDNSTEGVISVSGSTVTYGGFSGQHESSGIATNTPIGTVVSTIDELDTYPTGTPKEGQTRADHAKVVVSNTEGDSAVYGVVSRFDENDKVMVASVGIGSVLVKGACAKGDLLESNGDGTAKVQSDDVVKSKTIGKVTIGNSATDVKLVSCVLYCG